MPHIHKKIDFTVEVFVVHEHRVLLRMHDKYGLWLSVGGHIELDEDPNQAAIREVKEEVGLDVMLLGTASNNTDDQKQDRDDYHELIPPRFLNRHRISPIHEHIALTYFATAETDQVVTGSHDRSESWRWLTRSKVEDDPELEPHVRRYALTALDAVGAEGTNDQNSRGVRDAYRRQTPLA
jgi:8-oxo-dGTP pyrophosphatase MutT (NUDIX family)